MDVVARSEQFAFYPPRREFVTVFVCSEKNRCANLEINTIITSVASTV